MLSLFVTDKMILTIVTPKQPPIFQTSSSIQEYLENVLRKLIFGKMQ